VVLVDTVCFLAGDEHLIGDQSSAEVKRLRRAIDDHDTPYLFERLMVACSMQGISDHAAYTYMERHGRLTWEVIERAMELPGGCSKLDNYWAFENCGYEKGSGTCAEPTRIGTCCLPRHPLRNGRLNRTATSLYLFIRDVADCDLVSWIDGQLRRTSAEASDCLSRMREALIGPMRNVFGVSDKVLSMALSDLLVAAPKTKRHWFETGASMVVVDTLTHNWLHRSGILRRFNSQHALGPACYRPNGCADIITQIATQIDARQTNSKYPATFPRWVQHSIWSYCAQQGLDVCNGNRVHDERRCANRGCPVFNLCDRVALHPVRS
jgi:hypothetical protein